MVTRLFIGSNKEHGGSQRFFSDTIGPCNRLPAALLWLESAANLTSVRVVHPPTMRETNLHAPEEPVMTPAFGPEPSAVAKAPR